jgi:hypothetical protein
MNISKLISDSLRGEPPRPRERQTGGLDISPAVEFLEREVWPLLREARLALESKGFIAIAVAPGPDDKAHTHALLILDGGTRPEDTCAVKFLIRDQRLHVKVEHPHRSDAEPFPLDPPGSVMLVQAIIEDFIYHCLAPRGAKGRARVVARPRERVRAEQKLESARHATVCVRRYNRRCRC